MSAASLGLTPRASAPLTPKLGDPRRVVVDIVPVRKFAVPVALATFRTDAALQNVALVKNTRLSTMPLTAAELARIVKLGGTAR